MGRGRVSVGVARLWRARRRIALAVVAASTAVRCWDGWPGWAVGLFAAAGVLLVDFRDWWEYVVHGGRPKPPVEPPLTGRARFRESGSFEVRLLQVGDRRGAVAHRLRYVTGLDDAGIDALLAALPTTLPDALSLRSAERVVDALRDGGAQAELRILGNFSIDPSDPSDPSADLGPGHEGRAGSAALG